MTQHLHTQLNEQAVALFTLYVAVSVSRADGLNGAGVVDGALTQHVLAHDRALSDVQLVTKGSNTSNYHQMTGHSYHQVTDGSYQRCVKISTRTAQRWHTHLNEQAAVLSALHVAL